MSVPGVTSESQWELKEDCGWAVGGTGTAETGAGQKSESVHGKGGVLLSWEQSWKQCHVLQEETTQFPKIVKIL